MAESRVDVPEVPFDRQSLLERVDGDEEVMGIVLGVFLEDAPLSVAAIRQAVESGDSAQLRLTAHALKGAAANISAEELRAVAGDLEMMGASDQLAGATEALGRMEAALTRVVPILERVVTRQ